MGTLYIIRNAARLKNLNEVIDKYGILIVKIISNQL